MVQTAALMISRWFCGQFRSLGLDGCWWYLISFSLQVSDSLLHDSSCRCVAIAMALIVMLGEPLIWRNFWVLHGFSTRNAPWLMGFRYRWFMKPSLWISWWLLKCEIVYLHNRFRAAGQGGEMMVDIEGVFQSLDEYLTGGVTNVGAAEHPGRWQ